MECKVGSNKYYYHSFDGIDLTRMECKALTGSIGHRDKKSIDLTRMECKVKQNYQKKHINYV